MNGDFESCLLDLGRLLSIIIVIGFLVSCIC